MSFFSDLGDLGHAVFTGRWMGGENSVGDVVKKDPWTLLAPLGVAAGGLGLAGAAGAGGLGGLFGAAEGAGALGAAEGSALLGGGEALGGGALGFAGEAGAAGGEGLGAIESALGAGGADASALFPGYGTAAAGETAAMGEAGALFPGYGANIPGAAGAGADAAGGGSSFLGKLGQGAMDSVTKNPLGIGAAGLGLGMNLLKGNPTDPNQQKLQQQADQLGAQGQALQQYLANGTLPPAMKASLDQATAAAKARIVANHAKNGMPTNADANSALAQELNAVDTNAVAAMASAQIEMMKTGLNATGLSTQLYEMLSKMDRQNNQDLMSAIQSFAAALGGGGGKTQTFKLAA